MSDVTPQAQFESPQSTPHDLVEFVNDKMRLHLHPGQQKAWDSKKRIVAVLAGCQAGKTTFGPPWLFREIQQRGPGDYLIVCPSFPLLEKKALPTFINLFGNKLKLGEYNGWHRQFRFFPEASKRLFGHETDEETKIFFGHAGDPESLESATAKAAWLDEAGQNKFRLGSWEAIQRRLSIHQGRVLITTTPYNLGFIKQKLWDPWEAAKHDHPEIEVIRFDSTENPSFPQEEFERAKRDLPLWKFNMFYRAIFSRPSGLIYDCFDSRRHKVARFAIPNHWRRHLGLDFGGINTAGVFLAENPDTKALYVYREYRPYKDGTGSTHTARQHVEAILAGEPRIPIAVGGAKSEQNWREEYRAAGLPVQEPEIMDSSSTARNASSVEVGISRVYAAINSDKLFFFDHLDGLLDELESYSRGTDELGEPTDEIEDKSSYHGLDSLRYIVGHLRRPTDARWQIGLPDPRAGQGSLIARAPEGVFLDPRGDWRSSDKRLNERVKNMIGVRKMQECEDF